MDEITYQHLGQLSNEDFLAVKAAGVNKIMFHLSQIRAITRENSLGVPENIRVSQIRPRDTITIVATINDMRASNTQTGNIDIENIQDIYFEEATRMLTIENDKYIFTTLECKESLIVLRAVLELDNWLDYNALVELMRDNPTMSEYKSYEQNRDRQTQDIGVPSHLF